MLEAPVDKTEALTQQERVFLSQLITIEDRVRSQVGTRAHKGDMNLDYITVYVLLFINLYLYIYIYILI